MSSSDHHVRAGRHSRSDSGHPEPPRTPRPFPALQAIQAITGGSVHYQAPIEPIPDAAPPQTDSSDSYANSTSSVLGSPQLSSPPRSVADPTFFDQVDVPRIRKPSLLKDLPPLPVEAPSAMPVARVTRSDEGVGYGTGSFYHPPQHHPTYPGDASYHHPRGRSTGEQNNKSSYPRRHTPRSPSAAYHVSRDHNSTYHTPLHHSRPRLSSTSHGYASRSVGHEYNETYPVTHDASRISPSEGFVIAHSEFNNDVLVSSPSEAAVRGGNHIFLTRTPTTISRSRRHPSIAISTPPARPPHKLKEPHYHIPDSTPTPDDSRLHRPHTGFDKNMQTRYVRMLLAMDHIPDIYVLLASFFTWILLAGFILFPGTFASLGSQSTSGAVDQVEGIIRNVPLLAVAWTCTGIGGCGMIWLWWQWQGNYIWIVNHIFVPGFLNSLAGVISTLSNVYGNQGGIFTSTAESTIIVTGVVTLICGILVLIYQFVLVRNLRKEHEKIVGVEKAGKHGEGILVTRSLRREIISQFGSDS